VVGLPSAFRQTQPPQPIGVTSGLTLIEIALLPTIW